MSARKEHLQQLPFTLLRYYVCTLPAMAEAGRRRHLSFEKLSPEQRAPGHWYHFAGDPGLIEVRGDGSGQWHPDGVLPEGVDKSYLVEVPLIDAPHLLRDELIAAIDSDEQAASDAQLKEVREHVTELGSPAGEKHLAVEFQRVLSTIADIPEEKLRFLQHAAKQVLRRELMHGRATGVDAAALLMFHAVAKQLAQTPDILLAVAGQMASHEVSSLDELASVVIRDCWNRGLQEQATAALDELRQQGEGVIAQARDTSSVEGDPRLVLPYFYGGLLEALPYLLACYDGYDTLCHAPCAADEKTRYMKRRNTSEEKVVRLRDALLHAVRDRDLSELFSRQAFLRALEQEGKLDQVEDFIHDLIDLKFYYPPLFRSVLMPTRNSA